MRETSTPAATVAAEDDRIEQNGHSSTFQITISSECVRRMEGDPPGIIVSQ